MSYGIEAGFCWCAFIVHRSQYGALSMAITTGTFRVPVIVNRECSSLLPVRVMEREKEKIVGGGQSRQGFPASPVQGEALRGHNDVRPVRTAYGETINSEPTKVTSAIASRSLPPSHRLIG